MVIYKINSLISAKTGTVSSTLTHRNYLPIFLFTGINLKLFFRGYKVIRWTNSGVMWPLSRISIESIFLEKFRSIKYLVMYWEFKGISRFLLFSKTFSWPLASGWKETVHSKSRIGSEPSFKCAKKSLIHIADWRSIHMTLIKPYKLLITRISLYWVPHKILVGFLAPSFGKYRSM